MYRKKLNLIIVLVVLLFGNNQCSFFDKDVNCTAFYTVHIINKSKDTLGVLFVSRHPKDEDLKVAFSKDTIIIIMPYSFYIDTVKYKWTSYNKCVFEARSFYNILAYVYNVDSPDHTTLKELAPWDTTKSKGPSFCGDCTYTYTDTLIIP